MVEDLERHLKMIRKEERGVLGEIDKRNKERIIECGSCETLHKIGELILIQKHFYVLPDGCTGGDYWLQGGIQFVCPRTGVANRLLFNNTDIPWEERKRYENDPQQQFNKIYKHLFREVVDVREGEELERNWVNNYYVDEHREEFGLVAKRK